MTREAFVTESNVSRETLDRFDLYAERLVKWNKAINLVAKPTLKDIWTRHFLDSIQLLDHAPKAARHWVDLGAGAGFPGLAVAIAAQDTWPDLSMTLVESDQRKAVFLNETARACGISVAVICGRVEAIDLTADIVSARALASVTQLLTMAESILSPDGVALFLKGAQVETELTDANQVWDIEYKQHNSRADSRGIVLEVNGFHRRKQHE